MKRLLAVPLAFTAVLWSCDAPVSGPPDGFDPEPSFAKGGKGGGQGGSVPVQVTFRSTASDEVGDFFGGRSLDFSGSGPVEAKQYTDTALDTDFVPFTLSFEDLAGFRDGKASHELCETGFLQTILAAAEDNGGYLDGMLRLLAEDHPKHGTSVLVLFQVAVESAGFEYELRVPFPSPAEDRIVDFSTSESRFAVRNGHFRIRSAELDRNDHTWWYMETCNRYSDAPEPRGFIDFEVEVVPG
jgi:hypothetical protein